jgi:hypothetical protein
MNPDVSFQCRCGEVRGTVAGASPRSVNRVVCYCDDCQAFAHHLGRADLLDAQGGTDIVQVAPAALSFRQGDDRVVGLRLSPKGLFRWYSNCCHTPMGNTLAPAIPFIGIVAQVFEDPDAAFGRVDARVQGKYAIGTPPRGSDRLNFGFLLGALRRIVGWKLGGKTWPHPYFDRATQTPNRAVTILSGSEREALRTKCGPRPAAA